METKSVELLRELNGQIEFLESEIDNILLKTEEIIKLILKTLDSLKKIVIKHKFKSKHEEIHFFKNIKPQFTSKLYFHMEIRRIASQIPIGGIAAQKVFYELEQSKIKEFFDDNLDFYQYYRTNSTFLDERYFLRGNLDYKINLFNYNFEFDQNFSTTHDYKVALIMANDLLSIYIDKRIMELDNSTNGLNLNQKSKLKWSSSKAALIELLYALYKSNSLNGGNIEFSEIVREIESFIGIDLGNYYKTIGEIKNRKNTRTKFLQFLNDNLNQHFIESDE